MYRRFFLFFKYKKKRFFHRINLKSVLRNLYFDNICIEQFESSEELKVIVSKVVLFSTYRGEELYKTE